MGYFNEVMRQIVLILPKMTGYIEEFKENGGDKNKGNKLMSLHVDGDKLLGKYWDWRF